MSMSKDSLGWASWLGRLRPERAVCAHSADLDAAAAEIEAFALSTSPQAIVVQLAWDELPRLSDELEGVARALAQATLLRWPALYGAPFETDEAIERAAILDVARKVPQASPAAAQRIVDDCARGELPRLEQYALEVRVHQLSLALASGSLLIVLTTRSPTVSRDRAIAFARGAEWIADKAKARVIALLPSELSGNQDFDHISYGAFHAPTSSEWQALIGAASQLTPTPPLVRPIAPEPPRKEEAPSPLALHLQSAAPRRTADGIHVALGVVLGQPHPGSESEKLLHSRIMADFELRHLFHYNRIIATSSGGSPCVDLVWHEGKLIVEIDGEEHRSQHRFIQDRRRDYELLLDGYQVLRITATDVLSDCELVAANLRKLSRAINQRKTAS